MKLIAEIDASEKNEAIMKRLKQLITVNYREPNADGKFEECNEEVLQKLTQQDKSDKRISTCIELKFEPSDSNVYS